MSVGILQGIYKARDKPRNSLGGNRYNFLFGGTTSGKPVNEHTAMQMTAVYHYGGTNQRFLGDEFTKIDASDGLNMAHPDISSFNNACAYAFHRVYLSIIYTF